MRVPALIAAITAASLAACSTGSAVDHARLDAWAPESAGLEPVACAELLDTWANPEVAPARCWTFIETDGLAERYRDLAHQLQAQIAVSPMNGPECTGGLAPGRDASCLTVWPDGDHAVFLTAGITLHALEEVVAAGTEIDPTTPLRHELVLFIGADGDGA